MFDGNYFKKKKKKGSSKNIIGVTDTPNLTEGENRMKSSYFNTNRY